jgi:hypothetical protein
MRKGKGKKVFGSGGKSKMASLFRMPGFLAGAVSRALVQDTVLRI